MSFNVNEFMHRIVGMLPWREESTLLAMQEATNDLFPEHAATTAVEAGVKDGTGAPVQYVQFPPIPPDAPVQ